MSFFGKLFKRKHDPQFDLERAVGEYLINLPRCNRNVVIVSPKYGETRYACDIVVAAEDLAPWAEHHAEAVWSSNQKEQAARKALPIWLRGAKSEGNAASYVPPLMYKVLRPYVLDFVNDGAASIYCPECEHFIDDVNMQKLEEKRSGNWSWWTDVWKCRKGHQLYYEEHELHINLRR